ncbi:PqiC family protein [Salinibacter altiplanensis]|uniref:PqiC family protein n=1 Tax=Salinibacter altiplanensis TaxID=1803181 RepID=UPI000C9F6EB7|nr:PqiC family protein [Salinibacter altiplanensis]
MTVSSASVFLRRLGLGVLAMGLVGLAVAGCVRLLEPRTSDATYHLLDGASSPDTVSAEGSSPDTTGLRIGLRTPRLASYLDETRIVTRHDANTIEFSEFHRWGEDLDQGIGRSVARALEARPGVRSVEMVPWPRGATFDYLLQLHVLRFEGVGPRPPGPDADDQASPPEGHVRTRVRWTILDPADETMLARDRTEHRTADWPVTDYRALTTRLGASLGVLADSIGARLEALDRR